jgi:single-stranded-DNA-specific exonuclease
VVGIVASRVLERFYRPTLVLGTQGGKAKGSGRSTHAFDLFAALDEVRHEFAAFGGHFHAVGMSLEHAKIGWLRDHLTQRARERIPETELRQPLEIDGVAPFATLGREFLEALVWLEPYGVRNPRPKWLIPNAQLGHIKRVGKAVDSNHARVTFVDASQEQAVIAFGMADELETAARSSRFFQLVVEGRLQLFRGVWKPELRLVDFAPVEGGPHDATVR